MSFFNLQKALTILFLSGAMVGILTAQESDCEPRKGLLKRLFANKLSKQADHPTLQNPDKVLDPSIDRDSDTLNSAVAPYQDQGATGSQENDPLRRFPAIPGYNTIKNCPQHEIESLIDEIYEAYESRIEAMKPPDLSKTSINAIGKIPSDFVTVWRDLVRCQVWESQGCRKQSVEDIYLASLEHSNQVKVFSDIPLIRETGMQEADGEFDPVVFVDAGVIRRNEPNGSLLTAQPGVVRFKENQEYLETGVRKKFSSGAEATLSNRVAELNDNSGFLRPQNQGSSEMILSVVQPLLEGSGYHYNHSKIKIAKFDANMASSEFLRQLQNHLLGVNHAYWSLYYARSSYLLQKQLVVETTNILAQLEDRADLEALESEVLRARASLANRRSVLARAEVAIRNSEERLRALVNDPNHDIGSNSEMIPSTRPILSNVIEDVQTAAKEALHNRPEIQQGFDQLRSSVVRRDMQRNEKWPTLNLISQLMLSDIKGNNNAGSALKSQFGDTGYHLGIQFEQSLDNDEERARLLRREIELRQQANQLKATIDAVLLESVVSYRDLITSYRDMLGSYETLKASREELRQLRSRLEIDTEAEGGHSIASLLQIILDSMDRNQQAEESFLNSVVAYNASFAALEKAKGTLLRKQNVEIDRIKENDITHKCDELEKLKVTAKGPDNVQGQLYGKATPKNATYQSPTEPARSTRKSAEQIINESIESIRTIPMENLPSQDGLLPLKPISPPSVEVKPLQSVKPPEKKSPKLFEKLLAPEDRN